MTSAVPKNIHATAIVIGRRGLLFVGPSGIGKSMMAFTCLSIARRQRATALLIADDQVFVTREEGRIIATSPSATAGMMELRGSGIIRMDHIPTAAIDLAVKVVSIGDTERLPSCDERLKLDDIGDLPVVRVASTAPDPLSVIGGLIEAWRNEVPFW